MRSLEDELREAYRSVTGTVREQDLPGLYERRARCRRRSRFSAFAPLAAAAAVVVAVGFGLVMPGLHSSAPGRLAAPTAIPATPRTTPPFMIIVNTPNARRPLAVVSAATGRTTATVAVPRKGTGMVRRGTHRERHQVHSCGHAAARRPVQPHLPVHADPVGQRDARLLPEAVDCPRRARGDRLAECSARTAAPWPSSRPHAAARISRSGSIRGGRMKTWREPYPLFADDLSLSARGASSGTPSPPSPAGGASARAGHRLGTGQRDRGQHDRVHLPCCWPRALNSPSAPRTSPRCTFPGLRTARDTFHLAGYRIGGGGVHGTLFSRTMPGEMVSLAGGQVLPRTRGFPSHLADPVTGKATRIRTAWTNAWGIFWLRPRPPAP